MISCHNLTKSFGKNDAVSEASFDVSTGTICALLGPNGAGKSTLVKMLTGLLKPSAGTAQVNSISITERELKSTIGVLPESLALFDGLTISEHLRLTGSVYGLTSAETRLRTDQLLRILTLEHGRHTFIHQCSYGMKKKTALAMALLPNSRALFLDEPFEGIDPVTAETIRVLLRTIAGRGVTVLLTSHILSLVEQVADQVIVINKGRIALDGPIADLPKGLERSYFDIIQQTRTEELGWLGFNEW